MAGVDNCHRNLIALIGDEDTCVGFLLGGIGEVNRRGPSYFVVDRDTPSERIEEAFKTMVARDDVAILLITRVAANHIRGTVDAHHARMPTVLEIPSQYDPYDPEHDAVLTRAKKKVAGDDTKHNQDDYHAG